MHEFSLYILGKKDGAANLCRARLVHDGGPQSRVWPFGTRCFVHFAIILERQQGQKIVPYGRRTDNDLLSCNITIPSDSCERTKSVTPDAYCSSNIWDSDEFIVF